MPKTILLVEDETAIAFLLEDAFSESGFNVIPAATGYDALEVLENKAYDLTALVTDIRLGDGPDGWHVGWRARELKPSLPVLYMSGDSAVDWQKRAVPNSIMVAKPFVLEEMVAVISSLAIGFQGTPCMTRYFFNVIAGAKLIRDLEGTELPDLDAVRAEALKDIRFLMSVAVLEGFDISERKMEVCDDTGKVVMVVGFADAVTRQE